jgi:peroxiredoxin
MRQKVLALLFITLATFGCQRNTTTTNNQVTAVNATTSLPSFEAVDSEGKTVRQGNLTGTPSVVAFFDVDSVLAWRSLAKLEQAFAARPGGSVNIVGIGAVKSDSQTNLDVNSLKREYKITFPVIFDGQKKLSTLFDAPNCCDYLYLYDSGGAFKSSEKLSVAYAKFDELAAELFGEGQSKPDTSDLGAVLKVSDQSASGDLLPVADHGLTIVNLFDQFCADCVSGDRLQTLERLAQLHQTTIAMFSDKNFSAQDIDNFKQMLPTRCTILRGDIEAARPHLNSARLLLVLDAQRRVLWREEPEMSEQDIFVNVKRLVEAQAR